MSPLVHHEERRGLSRSHRVMGLLGAIWLAATVGGTARADAAVERESNVEGRVTREERPFGFVAAGTTPSREVWSLGYTFATGSGISAERPIPVDMMHAGASHTLLLAYGLTGRLAPFASVTISAREPTSGLSTTVMAGTRYQFTDPEGPLHLTVSGAVIGEGASGSAGISALAAASFDGGPICFATNLQADRVFATGRDSVDLTVSGGISYRVLSLLRLGVEYVGQDLEDAFEEDAEGGARMAAGPSAALDLDRGRYQITIASAFGLTAKSPTAVFRAGITFNY